MSTQMDQAIAAEEQASSHLRGMEAEIASLPALIQAAEKKARGAKDEHSVLACLSEKEQLEKRLKALPYLVPQARVDVLRAKADIQEAREQVARRELPEVEAEFSDATRALEEAQQRMATAEAAVKKVRQRVDGSANEKQKCLQDAGRIADGKQPMHYFTGR